MSNGLDMPDDRSTWRVTMITIIGSMLFAALHAAAIDGEDRINHGQFLGEDTAELIATAPDCYCQETCNP